METKKVIPENIRFILKDSEIMLASLNLKKLSYAPSKGDLVNLGGTQYRVEEIRHTFDDTILGEITYFQSIEVLVQKVEQ